MQRYFSNKINGSYFEIKKEDLYHIYKVMRYKENDEVEVVYNNELYIGKISKNGILVSKKIKVENEIKPYITICIPLLKENKMDYILQKSCELGVDCIIPIITTRSIIKIDGKEEKKIERWKKIVKEASEQSKRLDIPTITNIKQLKDLNIDGLKILCSTLEKENTLKNMLSKKEDKVTFIMGPEGGLTPLEEEQLCSLGFIKTTLGQRILRAETVPLFLLSALNYEYMVIK